MDALDLLLALCGLPLVLENWGYSSLRGASFSLQASPGEEHRLSTDRPQYFWHTGLVLVADGLWRTAAVAHRLRCSVACGIFPDQGSNWCPLRWQGILIHCATREVPMSTTFNIQFSSIKYMQCCATFTTIHFQHFLIIPNRRSVSIKQWLPFLPSPGWCLHIRHVGQVQKYLYVCL